jgi:pyruvate dehydrogenase E2 component (dihydrolipoamide acetyltransferase)
MAFQLILPDIGEGIVEAEVQKWFVGLGDLVVEDQPLVEVMTDKATVTIPSPRRGRVTRLLWREGDIARVHAPLLELEVEGGVESQAGASFAPGDVPVTIAASATVAAPVPVSGAAPLAAPDTAPVPHPETPPAQRPGKALATPAVRALARQLDIDVGQVRGTGPGERVTKDDLRRHSSRNGHPAPVVQPPVSPAADPSHRLEIVPLRGVRRRIAEKMALSKRTAAHATFVEEADVTELVQLRERMAAAARDGAKLTFLPFFVKAAIASLKRFPSLNASLDEEKGEIQLKHWYDLGIASATEQGLTVPVIRHADQRSLLDLAREIERLSAATKAGQVRPEDMGGSTFTISSLGPLGGLFATPIINYPEVGILGLHRMRPTPVARDGQVVVREVMHVSLSFDHRVIDGQVAAAFTYAFLGYLEDPGLLFLEMA